MTNETENEICECGHKIIKRKGIWKHKTGGTYCKARWLGDKALLGGCLCHNATPKKFTPQRIK